MVAYNGGDPRIPGNAELEDHEVAAFKSGDARAVEDIGRGYGKAGLDFAVDQGPEGPEITAGARALMDPVLKSPELTLTTMLKGIPFLEGVLSGIKIRSSEISWQMMLSEKLPGLAVLAELSQRPEIHEEATRQTMLAFDRIVSAVHNINSPPEPLT